MCRPTTVKCGAAATLVQPRRAPPKPRALARDGQVAPRHTEQNNQESSVLNKGSTEQPCLLFPFCSLTRQSFAPRFYKYHTLTRQNKRSQRFVAGAGEA